LTKIFFFFLCSIYLIGGLEPEVMIDAEVVKDIIEKEIPLSFEDGLYYSII
jgi:hypothetical protein